MGLRLVTIDADEKYLVNVDHITSIERRMDVQTGEEFTEVYALGCRGWTLREPRAAVVDRLLRQAAMARNQAM